MKKFKKTLGLMLAFAMILALVPCTSVSAAPSSYVTYYAPFNNAAPFEAPGRTTFIDLYYDNGLATISQSEGGLFGKAATDFGAKVSPTASGSKYINLYASLGADGIDGTTTYQMQFQLATDANGGFDWTSWKTLQLKNNAKTATVLFSVRKDNGVNKVQFLGMDTDFVWEDNTWHDVNFIVEQGANATLTAIVDGEPLKAAAGTFDGVKTTAYRVPLANTDRIISWKSMRVEVPDAAQSFYLDNWNVSAWPQGAWPAGVVKGDLYKLITAQYEEADMNSVMWKTDSSITLTLVEPADAPAYNLMTGKGGWIRGYLNGTEDDRTDVTHALSFDFMIPDTNTTQTNFWGFENSAPGGAGAINSVFGRSADATNNDLSFVWHAYEVGNRYSDYLTIQPDNSWHNFEVVYGMESGINNTPSAVFYADGMAQNTPITKIKAPNNQPEIRIYNSAAAWGIAKYTRTTMKNKPLFNTVTYGSATDDYAVDPTVDTITVTLTDTIAAADNTTVLVRDAEGEVVPAEVTLGEDKKTLTIALGADLATRANYQIVLTDGLVCEDSAFNGGWYQELENELVYDFMTGYKAFDWKKVQFTVSERQANTDPETQEVTYTWKDPVDWTYGYISDNWKVGANITAVNNTGADKAVTGIIAIYNPNDTLRYVYQQPLTFAQGESTQTLLSDPVANTSGMKVKVYLWETIDNMTPVTQSFFIWQKHADHNGPIIPGMHTYQQ